MTRASTARRAGVVVTGLVALSSCNANSPSGTTDDGCRDVDSAVIEEAMSSTKSDFETPDGATIDRLKFDDAASVLLPADQQMFGVVRHHLGRLRLRQSHLRGHSSMRRWRPGRPAWVHSCSLRYVQNNPRL